MQEVNTAHSDQANGQRSYLAVPAARPLSDFSMERVGDNVVLFDVELNRYHTVNGVAYDIWRQCDGIRSVDDIVASAGAQREVVEATIELLGEAGLLSASESEFDSKMHRRKMVKLVAAGVLGAVGIPVVASITRLGPEASATQAGCENCQAAGGDKCCCYNSNGKTYTCADRGTEPGKPNQGCCDTNYNDCSGQHQICQN